MKNNYFLFSLLFGLAVSCAQSPATSSAQSKIQIASRPNILLIIADDLTHRDIGCYGSQNVKTPHIDAIAREGMRFTRCFQAAPMCSPTRHNLYTGIYPVRSGAYPNHAYARKGTKSVVHHLEKEGYRVGLTGKKHIAPKESFPFDYLGKGGDPDLNALEEFMTRDKEQPFCAFVCYREPHTPWDKGDPGIYDPDSIILPPYLVDTKETRKRLTEYFAEINHLDNSVGDIRALLDKHQVAENTLLIFTSEQGNAFPFAKWTCYDNGLQTAFIARWPGHIAANSSSDAMIEYVDVTPTFVDLAGGDPIDSLDGRSFLPVLLGQASAHKQYVFGVQTTRGINNGSDHYGIRSIRSAQFKYVMNLTPEATFQNNVTVNSADWNSFWPTWVDKAKNDPEADELVQRFQHRPAEELYDVITDPYEMNNLAQESEHEEIKKDLRARLLSWMEQQGDRGQQTEMEALEHKVSFLKQK
ncbi:MAG: sulfatase [Bacteroidota bacterium]